MKKFLYSLVIGAMISTPAFALASPAKSKSAVSADDTKKKPAKGKKGGNGKDKKKGGDEGDKPQE
jgi:hypothetical protein